MIDTKESAFDRWQAIDESHRLIGVFSALLLIFALSIFIRPDNSVSRFWEGALNIQPDWVVWVLVISAFLSPLFWYLWRSLVAVSLATSPLLALVALLIVQLAQSSTAPLFHGATAFGFVFISIFAFYLTRELTIYKGIANRLADEKIDKRITDTLNASSHLEE